MLVSYCTKRRPNQRRDAHVPCCFGCRCNGRLLHDVVSVFVVVSHAERGAAGGAGRQQVFNGQHVQLAVRHKQPRPEDVSELPLRRFRRRDLPRAVPGLKVGDEHGNQQKRAADRPNGKKHHKYVVDLTGGVHDVWVIFRGSDENEPGEQSREGTGGQNAETETETEIETE